MRQIIEKIRNKENLSFDESKSAFELLMSGKAQDQEIFDFLTSLSDKGETSEEIAGGVYILREKSKRVEINNCIDTCGTGGDGMNTLNISTASALLLASMGVKVAKHGNKAVSSKCGSGDVLEALNIRIDLEPNDIENQINDLDDKNEKKNFMEMLNIKETGLNNLIQKGYNLLSLETFFTSGPEESRAWTITKNCTAPKAAGEIHTDFEKGFIRAETISYDDFIKNEGWVKSKENGKMRLEGKDYIVKDGDVLNFRFNTLPYFFHTKIN